MDLVNKVEAPSIKFLENLDGLHKGARVGLAYSRGSWEVAPEGAGEGEILSQNDAIAVVELQEGSIPKKETSPSSKCTIMNGTMSVLLRVQKR